jgi:hypothetical protein
MRYDPARPFTKTVVLPHVSFSRLLGLIYFRLFHQTYNTYGHILLVVATYQSFNKASIGMGFPLQNRW